MTQAHADPPRPAAWVPPLERTDGQAAPIAANEGLSYAAFERDGDAGTAAATEDALLAAQSGETHALLESIQSAPPGPIETKWGLGFRRFTECVDYIRDQAMQAPEGGAVVPLRYSVKESPSYSIVSSNALWQDPERSGGSRAALRRDETRRPSGAASTSLKLLRDARRIEDRTTRASHRTRPSAWTSSASRWLTSNRSAPTSTTRPRWSGFTTRRSSGCSSTSSRAPPTRSSTTTTCSTRTMRATGPKTRPRRIRA